MKTDRLNLQDKLDEITAEQVDLNSEDNPQMRTIRMLENKLDKAMIKYNEAQSIRKTYEMIVKRLKDERVGYDNQLAAIEQSLKGKEHDFEELLLLSHDANHAKEVADAELRKFEARIQEKRELRDNEVKEQKKVVELRVDQQERLEKNAHDKQLQKIEDQKKQQENMQIANVKELKLVQDKIDK